MNTVRPSETSHNPQGPILFYDGDCGVCKGSVGFVLRHERHSKLTFAPLQGPTAKEALRLSPLPDGIGQNTVVLYENGQYLVRSQAVLRTLEHMGGGWITTARFLKIIPTPVADLAYRIIARLRNKLPAGNSCEILSPDQRHRFLP